MMFKKGYASPELNLKLSSDVLLASGDGFGSDVWDNSTEGEIIL